MKLVQALLITLTIVIALYLYFRRITVNVLIKNTIQLSVYAGKVKMVEKMLPEKMTKKYNADPYREKRKSGIKKDVTSVLIKTIKYLPKCLRLKEIEMYIEGMVYRFNDKNCELLFSPSFTDVYGMQAKLIIYPIKTMAALVSAQWETMIEKLRKNQVRKEWNRSTEC